MPARQQKEVWFGLALVLVFAAGVIGDPPSPRQPGTNLVINGSFEQAHPDNASVPLGWSLGLPSQMKGRLRITDRAVHTGKGALEIQVGQYTPPATGYVQASAQQSFAVPKPGTELTISAWIKADDVVAAGPLQQLRLIYHFFSDEDKVVGVGQVAVKEGTFDWTHVQASTLVPKRAARLRLLFALTGCTGTAWCDDIEVMPEEETSVDQILDRMAPSSSTTGPIIIPTPRDAKPLGGQWITNALVVTNAPMDPRTTQALRKICEQQGLPLLRRSDTGAKRPDTTTAIHFLKTTDPKALTLSQTHFPDLILDDLGSQGYLLVANERHVFIIADSPVGQFYGVQTLGQIIQLRSDKTHTIAAVAVADNPTLALRGIPVGLGKKNIDYCAANKLNFMLHTGSYLNHKFGGNPSKDPIWRQPFTDEELSFLKQHHDYAQENFVDICLMFSPRGIPPAEYSSPKDARIIANKIATLYRLGFRNFGLSYDDLGNVGLDYLFHPKDQKRFGEDLGAAHAYFTEQVYRQVIAKHPDITFWAIPTAYTSYSTLLPRDQRYLESFGQMPTDIGIIACQYRQEDLDNFLKTLGRDQILIWDNYFGAYERTGRTLLPPLERPAMSRDQLKGYIFLTTPEGSGDPLRTFWKIGSDYAWSPQRYDAEASLERAVSQSIAGTARQTIGAFTVWANKIYELPTTSKDDRLRYIADQLVELDRWRQQLHQSLPETLAADVIAQEWQVHHDNLIHLQNTEQNRAFPVTVARALAKPDLDPNHASQSWPGATVLRDFLPVKNIVEHLVSTEVELTYDDQFVYLRVVCDEPNPAGIRSQTQTHDDKVYLDDAIELFIQSEQDQSGYYHIAINTHGIVYDVHHLMREDHYVDLSWDSRIDVKTQVFDDHWVLTAAIPASVFNPQRLESEASLRMNICRSRQAGEKPQYSSYASLLPQGGYHQPMFFSTIVLSK